MNAKRKGFIGYVLFDALGAKIDGKNVAIDRIVIKSIIQPGIKATAPGFI